MRKPLIAGNWKMNMTATETEDFIDQLLTNKLPDDVEAAVCGPFTSLTILSDRAKDSGLKIGAQNVYFEEKGAFTGEVSAAMLKDINMTYVITGHSERREIFGETDTDVNKKNKAVLNVGMIPIVCVGETDEERTAGKHEEKVQQQVTSALEGLKEDDVKELVIAYEPIWAIGTGKSASSDDANAMCEIIRDTVLNLYNQATAENVRILYGGSVKPATIEDLMSKEHVDGALVGGASLKVDDYLQLLAGASHD
jgi:triosephosphate isomerase